MQSKLASFQRQLNLYGFRRFTAGPDKGGKDCYVSMVIFCCIAVRNAWTNFLRIFLILKGYYHELFLRGRPDLAEHIRRTKVKGAGHRKAGAPETEPNFYREFPLPNTPAINATGNQAFKVLVAPQVAVPSLAQQLPIQLGAAAFASSPTHIAAPTKESAKEASSEATNHDRQAGQTGGALSIGDQGITTTTTTLSDGVDTDATAAFTSIQLPEPTNKPYIAPVIEPLVPPETKAQLKRFDPSPFLQQGLFGPNSLLALSPPLGKAGPPMRPEYHNECIIMDALRAVAPFYPDPPV